MRDVVLLGAGKIGSAVARLLSDVGDYSLLVGDVDESALARLAPLPRVKTERMDVGDAAQVSQALRSAAAVVSACSFNVNPTIARCALESGASYFDLTEDVQTTRTVAGTAQSAREGQVFMPQCGLAPGFVSIAGFDLTQKFDRVEELHLRVGALPQFPTNEMKYNLTWSTDGLINEYGNPCEAIHNNQRLEVLPLEGLEHFSLDGVDYEAFNTSGGVGTLCDTFAGAIRTLNYKTIRYRGHRDLMAFLMNELQLNQRRAMLKDILESAVPVTPQDVVLIFCTATGWTQGRLTQITDARKVYHAHMLGDRWSAIQITTAGSLCAVVDLHFEGKLPTRGVVRQEQVRLADFLANRFGRFYASAEEISQSVAPWVRS